MNKITVMSRVGEVICVNPYSKQGASFLSNYKNAWKDDIYEVYDKPSDAKVSAYHDCKNLMQEVNGKRFRIPTHNCHSFTAAFTYIEDTGAEFVCYITVDHTYIVPKQF